MKNKFIRLFNTGFFHIFGGNVINKVISFLSGIILVHILTKPEYGIFTYSQNIYNIVILMSGMGIVSGFLQVSSEKGGKDTDGLLLSYAVKWGIGFNIFLSILLLLISLFVPLKVSGANDLLLMFCLLPIIQILYELSSCFLRSQKRNQEYMRLCLINTILYSFFSVCFVLYFKETGLIIGQYIAYIITLFYVVIALKIPIFRVASENKLGTEEKNSLLKISFISMCNNALSQLLYLLDVFVIGIIVADESVLASYKVAMTIPVAMSFIPQSLVIYIYPYFAQKRMDKQWCWKHYKQIICCFGLFNLVISLCLFFLAPWIVLMVFGAQYSDAIIIFRILALNYFVSGTFRVVSGNLLVTQRKLKFNLLVACVSGIVNVIADVVLIYFYGSIGAAVATMIVTLVSSVLSTTYFAYILNKR